MIELWAPVILAAAAGIAAFFIRQDIIRRIIWGLSALVHFAFSVNAAFLAKPGIYGEWVGIDNLSAIFLVLTSFVFLCTTVYGINYIKNKPAEPDTYKDDLIFENTPESIFTGCLLLFLASMTLVIVSFNFGLQWVAIEATTLTSAPLIYYYRHRRSLEAAWKYLIICSVAIALALMGVVFIGMSIPEGVEGFTINVLIKNAGRLDTQWLRLAFIFFLVGYGAKMGLAPMHTWLPDSHSEAPSPVSALLSGTLLNCSFLGIIRLQQVCHAAGIGGYGQQLLIVFGLISMGVAGVFIIRQPDYKRLLAYSSVEHMGIMAFGMGLGGIGVFGSLLHSINHSLVKSMLFLTSGNILNVYHSKKIIEISGLIRARRITGILWFSGFLAIIGSPPFGTFISEFTIIRAGMGQGHWLASALFLLFLSVVFVGMLKPFMNMSFGGADRETSKEHLVVILPPMIMLLIALVWGLYIPSWLKDILNGAAAQLGGTGL